MSPHDVGRRHSGLVVALALAKQGHPLHLMDFRPLETPKKRL
jgi:hypothetical protein